MFFVIQRALIAHQNRVIRFSDNSFSSIDWEDEKFNFFFRSFALNLNLIYSEIIYSNKSLYTSKLDDLDLWIGDE